MPETVTDVIIDASAERVWQVLTDLREYSDWNPLIRRVSGDLSAGARLSVTLATSDGSERTGHPTIIHYRPGREIRWRDRPVLPGIMDTESGFKVEPLGPEQVRFVHWQSTSGLLSPLLGSGADSKVRDQFDAMNQALKGQVERGPADSRDLEAKRDSAPAPVTTERRPVGSRPG